VTAMRHEAHVFLVIERKVPFDRQEQLRLQTLLERYIEQQFRARILKSEVRVF